MRVLVGMTPAPAGTINTIEPRPSTADCTCLLSANAHLIFQDRVDEVGLLAARRAAMGSAAVQLSWAHQNTCASTRYDVARGVPEWSDTQVALWWLTANSRGSALEMKSGLRLLEARKHIDRFGPNSSGIPVHTGGNTPHRSSSNSGGLE